jgi:hypothetical protein
VAKSMLVHFKSTTSFTLSPWRNIIMMSNASLARLRPTDLATSISLLTSLGRKYSRSRTSAFLGRRKILSVFRRFVLVFVTGNALPTSSSLPCHLSVKKLFYGLFARNKKSHRHRKWLNPNGDRLSTSTVAA